MLPSLAMAFPILTTSAAAEAGLLKATHRRFEELEGRLDTARGLERTRLLLKVGRHDEAWERASGLLTGGYEEKILAADILFAVHDYKRLPPLIDELAQELRTSGEDRPAVRRLAYRFAFAIDDLELVVQTFQERIAAGKNSPFDRLAEARLRLLLLDFPVAQTLYEEVLKAAESDAIRARSLHGLGMVRYRRRDFEGAFDLLTQALELTPVDADLLGSLADTLIRLSRTEEAIDLLELAVRLAPYHERSHYVLGNGYARQNYRELEAEYPQAFASGDGATALTQADQLFTSGELEDARDAYLALDKAYPGRADVVTRLGSLAFALRRYGAARRRFATALRICPAYGRAHNGLAKTIEAQRTRLLKHRETYAARFTETATPEVPGIEEYVVNWASLEPRHQKVVARAIAPWGRYVPVLLEAGSTHYIKPLHERLSECPNQELLRDQRINYDSRLWDDVRGVGGYHTVTGVEDVERIIWNGYNTVIHELTHQVHQVLPSEMYRRIQELYRRTKERDEKSGDAFLSRYAGGSVWEYFAEGANALVSPQRDRFDTRDIVRERLEEKDPALAALVSELMDEAGLEGAYTVALINRGQDRLRRGCAAEAIEALGRSLEKTPDSEDAASALIYALSVAGHAEEALALAEEKASLWPESAPLVNGRGTARWLCGQGLDRAIDELREARDQVRPDERYEVDLQLGQWAWTAGDAVAARLSYEAVLAYQADRPQGLWGLASAHALDAAWEEAWKLYEEAVRHRTGVVDLRTGYAADLLRAGEHERARVQLDAALLLDPEDADTLATEAFWLMEHGRDETALETAARAYELAPWCDTACLARAWALVRAGRSEEGNVVLAPLEKRIRDEAPPEFVFRPEKGSYVLAHALPKVLRDEVSRLRSELLNL